MYNKNKTEFSRNSDFILISYLKMKEANLLPNFKLNRTMGTILFSEVKIILLS